MHTSDIQAAHGTAAASAPVDPEALAASQAKALQAAAVRQDAYARLQLGEHERNAMEWAFKRKSSAAYADLLAFFEGSAAQETDAQALAWMNGPTFRGAGLESLQKGLAKAVQHYDKWQRSDRIAEVAENSVIWFLNLSMAAFVLVCTAYAVIH